jgi:hypothetical protein
MLNLKKKKTQFSPPSALLRLACCAGLCQSRRTSKETQTQTEKKIDKVTEWNFYKKQTTSLKRSKKKPVLMQNKQPHSSGDAPCVTPRVPQEKQKTYEKKNRDRQGRTKQAQGPAQAPPKVMMASRITQTMEVNDILNYGNRQNVSGCNCIGGTCIFYSACLPCMLLCHSPTFGARLAKQFGMKGFSRKVHGFESNRGVLQGLVLVAIVFNTLAYNIFKCPEYTPTDPRSSLSGESATAPIPATAVHFCASPVGIVFATVALCASMIFMLFFVLLRMKMRNTMSLKSSCCCCFGQVGDLLEDLFCVSACFPCALGQMKNQERQLILVNDRMTKKAATMSMVVDLEEGRQERQLLPVNDRMAKKAETMSIVVDLEEGREGIRSRRSTTESGNVCFMFLAFVIIVIFYVLIGTRRAKF